MFLEDHRIALPNDCMLNEWYGIIKQLANLATDAEYIFGELMIEVLLRRGFRINLKEKLCSLKIYRLKEFNFDSLILPGVTYDEQSPGYGEQGAVLGREDQHDECS